MQDKMTYMVVIKPNGKAHVVVMDRGAVECSKAEEIAHAMGEVEETEVVPEDDAAAHTLSYLGDEE